LANDLGVRLAGEQVFKTMPGRLFVDDDEHLQGGIGHDGLGWFVCSRTPRRLRAEGHSDSVAV